MRSIKRHVRQHIVVSIASLTTIFMLLAMGGVIISARTSLPPILEPPPSVMPGSSLPLGARCSWPNRVRGNLLYCYVAVDNDMIYLAYDVHRQVIIRTTVPTYEKPVGGYILAWGVPTGI